MPYPQVAVGMSVAVKLWPHGCSPVTDSSVSLRLRIRRRSAVPCFFQVSFVMNVPASDDAVATQINFWFNWIRQIPPSKTGSKFVKDCQTIAF